MAGDPGAAILLMAMGYDALSMNSTNLSKVKSVIRAIDLKYAHELLASVMKLKDAKSVTTRVEAALQRLGVVSRPPSLSVS
jgi:phosphotransferase system enzyme I (PtsP)